MKPGEKQIELFVVIILSTQPVFCLFDCSEAIVSYFSCLLFGINGWLSHILFSLNETRAKIFLCEARIVLF